MAKRIQLSDDGTLDTVLRCADCGQEFRFNYDGAEYEPTDDDGTDGLSAEQYANWAYSAWVADCIAETEAEHACQPTTADIAAAIAIDVCVRCGVLHWQVQPARDLTAYRADGCCSRCADGSAVTE